MPRLGLLCTEILTPTHASRGLQPIRIKLSQNNRETGFIAPSQTFDIAIIFERSQKK